ncbi:hypothetical protein EVAR_31890_1 [Eumeta japonica]|uniref:Uncharacterized protein n=1 Tax=Eumeta variegata TaxID=151549 RepID=A0A4C1WWW2_EUMVA|nr:hypothetical protein EVAR_31890_1 [Eumeta japonica]
MVGQRSRAAPSDHRAPASTQTMGESSRNVCNGRADEGRLVKSYADQISGILKRTYFWASRTDSLVWDDLLKSAAVSGVVSKDNGEVRFMPTRHILRKLPTVTSTRVQGALKQPTQPR